MQLADEGLEHLLEERSKPAGVAREATLLASLRVLVTALQTDVWLLQELRQVPNTGVTIDHHQPVDSVYTASQIHCALPLGSGLIYSQLVPRGTQHTGVRNTITRSCPHHLQFAGQQQAPKLEGMEQHSQSQGVITLCACHYQHPIQCQTLEPHLHKCLHTHTFLYLYSNAHHKQACLADTGHWTETLDAVLKRDTRRVSKLISCVGYTSSSAVQLEAIHLTQFFAARQPNLVDTLVQQKLTAGEDSLGGACLCAKASEPIMSASLHTVKSLARITHLPLYTSLTGLCKLTRCMVTA